MVTVHFTGKEGKTSKDCSIAKWILQRPGLHEKYLVVVKELYKHLCDYTWVTAAIISWDGLPRYLADRAYDKIASVTSEFGTETHQQCKANKKHVKEMVESAAALAVAGQDLGTSASFVDQDPALFLNSS